MKRKAFGLALSLSMALSLIACGGGGSATNTTSSGGSDSAPTTDTAASGDTVVLQCGMTPGTDSSYALAVEHLNEILQESTGGTLQFEVLADGLLGGERDLFEGLGLGTVDSCVISTGVIGNFVDDWYILDLPFLFDDNAQAYKVLDGEVGQTLMSELKSQGVAEGAIWECGWRQITSTNQPINQPSDVKGLKVRTMENSIHGAAWEALGVTPVPMAAGEVYTALQQGTLDGQEMPWLFFKSHGFAETQNNLCVLKILYSPALFMISDAAYSNLSDEHKAALDAAIPEATKWQRDYSQSFDDDYLKQMESEGKNVTYANLDEWRPIVQSVYDEYVPQMNQDLCKKLFEDIGREWTW